MVDFLPPSSACHTYTLPLLVFLALFLWVYPESGRALSGLTLISPSLFFCSGFPFLPGYRLARAFSELVALFLDPFHVEVSQ